MHLEEIGLIGNCQFSALVRNSGEVVWCCLPRFDSEPLFATLLDEHNAGRFLIGPASGGQGTQQYVRNTNVLETTFRSSEGSFRILDFAPRFIQHERTFRPTQIHRIIEPLDGTPRIRIVCDPRLGWDKACPTRVPGSHHVAFEGFANPLRLTTDIPLSYVDGQPFTLTGRRHLVLTWGEAIEEPLAPLCERFLNSTTRYWQTWVKHCDIPPRYQEQVIRSALALKLHCFEDTGAIIAASTTSIPESPGSGRTWDYRYCWLRDSYYALEAFRLLGQFEEREQFANYLLNIAGGAGGLNLAPLYRIDGRTDLEEHILEHWAGYNGEKPVRVGNGAATHVQNDVFGEMVLALTPTFLDERFNAERSPAAFKLVEGLARKAIGAAGTPDAGIWEFRTEWKPQTFSALMCWAAADRMAKIAESHSLGSAAEFRGAAAKIHAEMTSQAWCAERGIFAGHYGGRDLDAALLQMVRLRFLPPDDPQLIATVNATMKELGHNGWLYRYWLDDGFGQPSVAFIICTFWLIEALVVMGRKQEAAEIMDRVCATMTPLGLLAEDYEPGTTRMWGNFPQAYSHVGLIHAAFAASPSWEEML